MDKARSLYVRFALFIGIILGIVPFIIYFVSPYFATNFTYNFFSFPAYAAILLFAYVIYNREYFRTHQPNPTLKSTLIYSLIGIACFTLYLLLRIYNPITLADWSIFVLLFVLLYSIGSLCIACAIFGTTFLSETYHSLFTMLIIGFIYYSLTNTLWSIWEPLARLSSQGTISLLKAFYSNAHLTYQGTTPMLNVESFTVAVGAPCSGLESLTMFLGLSILLFIYERENLNPKRFAVTMLIGLLGVFILNIIRMSLLMAIGTRHPDFALGLFHSNAGWMFFSIFVLILLWFLYPWMRRKKTQSKKSTKF